MKEFPFKHLIWAVVVIVSLFAFRTSWQQLILQMEEVTIFGKVSIKVSKAESEALQQAEELYSKEIGELTNKLTGQDRKIASLTRLTEILKRQVVGCDNAKATVAKMQTQVLDIGVMNKDLKSKSTILNNRKILTNKVKRVK